LKDDLANEERQFAKRIATRTRQMTRALNNAIGIFGDVQGIAGKALPDLDNERARPLLAGGQESPRRRDIAV